MPVDGSLPSTNGLSVADRVASAERERLDSYSRRSSVFDQAVARADRLSLYISYARVVTFTAAAGSAASAIWWPGAPVSALSAAAVVSALAFVVLVATHARIETRKRWNQLRARQNREQAARVLRDWNAVPRAELDAAPPDHPYAGDLDLIGRASLADLLGAPSTPAGRRLLGDWLLASTATEVIGQRQEGVAELAPELEWRQQVHALGTMAAFDAAHLERFMTWAEEPPWLLVRPWLTWLARLLPVTSVVLMVLDWWDAGAGGYWLVPLLAAIILWYGLGRRLRDTFDRVEAQQGTREHGERLFRIVREHTFRTTRLRELAASLGSGRAAADAAFARLGRLMALVDLRNSSLLYFPVNALTLWDLHVLHALERWRVESGAGLRRWFETVGEVEALSSLAGLSHDNPDWVFPEFTAFAEPVLEARDLAHPLLPRGVRVVNDVRIGPPGRFLFVTGSNMSGKTTLLRAVGVNVVLGEAGGPVCASSLRQPRVDLRTVMRVQDSLELGISYFMASLNRLRRVVAQEPSQAAEAPPLLYLLDEILQGTNTAERQIAVRTILRHLLARPAIGALTSHDLTLTDTEDLRVAAEAVHFTEAVEGAADTARLSFDYRLRPGIATSRNALKLMRLIGLAADQRPVPDSRGAPR